VSWRREQSSGSTTQASHTLPVLIPKRICRPTPEQPECLNSLIGARTLAASAQAMSSLPEQEGAHSIAITAATLVSGIRRRDIGWIGPRLQSFPNKCPGSLNRVADRKSACRPIDSALGSGTRKPTDDHRLVSVATMSTPVGIGLTIYEHSFCTFGRTKFAKVTVVHRSNRTFTSRRFARHGLLIDRIQSALAMARSDREQRLEQSAESRDEELFARPPLGRSHSGPALG
jgi:hypothetical protein